MSAPGLSVTISAVVLDGSDELQRPRPYCPRCPACRRWWLFPDVAKLRRIDFVTTIGTMTTRTACPCGGLMDVPTIATKCQHCGHQHTPAEFSKLGPQAPILAGSEAEGPAPASGATKTPPRVTWREQWATCRCGHLLRADAGEA